MVLNTATLFFLRETGGPGEKPSYLSPSDHQFSDVFFFRSFLFFYFLPLFPFFDYFPCPIFLYSLLPHMTSKIPMPQFKTVNISNIILHRHFVGFFSFPAPPFSLFDNPVRHALVFRIVGTAIFCFSFEIPEHLLPDGLYIWICFRRQTFHVPNIIQMNWNFALTRLH